MQTDHRRRLLALVGVFDVVGTIASGWLTDRVDSRLLLAWYYALRGLSLFALPFLFAAVPHATMLLFIVFYGLDWVATVPPTVALCRERFGADGGIVFGWVFASHQVGAALAASAAGLSARRRQLRRGLARRGCALPGGCRPVGVGAGQPHRRGERRRGPRPHVGLTPYTASAVIARPWNGPAVGLRRGAEPQREVVAQRRGGARGRCGGRPRRPAGR
jgi:hypothetical protein